MNQEKMHIGMEKVFFRHILTHPDQFSKVDTYFFRDEDIQFIYKVIQEEYLKSRKVPSDNQIFTMLKLHETEREVTKELLKILLKGDNNVYDEEWIMPRYNAWKGSNKLKNHLMQSIEFVRGLDEINYDNVLEASTKIKSLINEVSMLDNDDKDLVNDFDDPNSHLQDFKTQKIPTGWKCLDTILNGGWDYSSLILLFGESSVGKSMWLHNIAVKMADDGKNVLLVTLEMASHKCMKRMGAMRLRIPADEYDEKSKDPIYMKEKINQLKFSSGMFEQKIGKIFVKKFPTSSCTVTELDNYIQKLQESKGVKIDAVLVDYLNLMSVEKGLDFNASMLYLKGKHIAEGLRYIGDKYGVVMITATQTDKAVWGANDLSLANVPESKAVVETADAVIGIIRSPEMKKHNKYKLKILKLRDGEIAYEQIRFDFNPKYLSMENDDFVE